MKTKTVAVPTISCTHCVGTITRELSRLEGVRRVQVDQKSHQVSIEWDESLLPWALIRTRLEEIGYPAVER